MNINDIHAGLVSVQTGLKGHEAECRLYRAGTDRQLSEIKDSLKEVQTSIVALQGFIYKVGGGLIVLTTLIPLAIEYIY